MYWKYKNKAYSLRISDELMEKIKELAEKNFRPVNKQIEFMLVDWLSEHDNNCININRNE